MALAGWFVRAHEYVPAYARNNDLDPERRRWIFINMGAGLAVALGIVAAIFIWKRRRGVDFLERLVRRSSPLSLFALVPLLFDHRLWKDRDLVFLPLVLAFGLGTRAAFFTRWTTEPAFPRVAQLCAALFDRLRAAGRPMRWALRVDWALAAVIAGSCAYAIYFSAITIANHRNFGTSAFDLGGWDNLMWNLVHGGPILKSTPFMGPTGSHLARHATFFAYVIAPIYWLAPRPETLLVIQAAVLGGAAIPLYLYARRHLPRWTAALVSYLYLLYPPLHGGNLYDFQFLTFGGFFLWLVLYAVEARRPILAVVSTVLALSVREDVALCLSVIGLFLLLRGTAVRAGTLLAIVGAAYFFGMKMGLMPHFSDGGETFVSQYAGLLPPGEHTFGSMLKTIVANPSFTANVILERDKLAYVMQLFVPVLFVPLVRPIGLLLIVPGFVFTLLSTGYWPLYQISFQYTSYWTAFVFVGVIIELERVGQKQHALDAYGPLRQRALAAGICAASFACSYLYGAILPHESLRAGFDPPRFVAAEFDLRRRGELASILPQIPVDAKIAASEHLVPHVSNRADVYTLRFGVNDADYLFVEVPIRGDERDKALPLLRDGTFGVVNDRGDMVLAKRGYDTSKNAGTLARIGP